MNINNGYIKNPPFPKHYGEEFLVIDRGEGCCLFDAAGKKYIDFGSGIAVNALGYGREDIAEAAAAQMKKLIHISNLFMTEPAVKLAEKLIASGPFSAVHLGNSGSEANEAALKYARIYALRTKGAGHHQVLSFSGGFHGRTMGALSATYKEAYKAPFEPMVPGFSFIPFNDIEVLKKTLNKDFCAVITEPIQGEGGLDIMSREFATTLNELCKEYGILIIADEIQTGIGRCGEVFASNLMGLKPDIITLAKPLAAGLPLSATLIPDYVNDLIKPGEHGGTFGGGPVTTTVASMVWDELTAPDFLQDVRGKSSLISNELQKIVDEIPGCGKVKGAGLLLGITVKDPGKISLVMEKAREKGLIILRAGVDVIRLAPPLVIDNGTIMDGLTILKETLKEIL